MKNFIKPLITAGLVLAALPIKSAAALRQGANRLTAQAGATLRTAATLRAATPALRRALPLTQTTRALATLSQSHKSYSNHKPHAVDLIPLGVIAAVTVSEITKEQTFANTSNEELMKQLKKEIDHKKQEALAFKILHERFESLEKTHLLNVLYNLPNSEETSSWILKTLNTKVDTLTEIQLCYLLDTLPESNEKSSWILNTLKTKFDTLTEVELYFLCKALPESEETSSWILNTLDTKLDTLTDIQLSYLLYPLPESKKSLWILNTLETKFDTLNEDIIYYLLNALPQSEKASSWILNTLETKFDTLNEETLYRLIKNLTESEETYSFILKVLKDKVDFFKQSKLFSLLVKKLPINTAKPFIDLIIRENPLLESLSSFKEIGPLFSATFLQNCIENIPIYRSFEELLPLITEHTAHEYTENRIVFYHGQSAQWKLLSDFYEALYELKHGIDLPADFIPLRFTSQSDLTDNDAAYLIKNGVYGTDHRPHLLFANLHLFSNHRGSNTWEYITENYDQSVNRGRYEFINNLTNIFNDLGFSEELTILQNEFIALQDLYTKAVELHDNQGTLIVISMPPGIASRISYSAQPGGSIKPLTINGTPTTNPVEIAANFDQVPFINEYCICLTKKILNPIEAQKAGIKMRAFSPLFDQQTQEGEEYKAALDTLMEKVKELYQARLAREEAAGK